MSLTPSVDRSRTRAVNGNPLYCFTAAANPLQFSEPRPAGPSAAASSVPRRRQSNTGPTLPPPGASSFVLFPGSVLLFFAGNEYRLNSVRRISLNRMTPTDERTAFCIMCRRRREQEEVYEAAAKKGTILSIVIHFVSADEKRGEVIHLPHNKRPHLDSDTESADATDGMDGRKDGTCSPRQDGFTEPQITPPVSD